MKICDKCGAQQAARRIFCVDCGAMLEKPVLKDEAERVKQKTHEKLDKMYDKSYNKAEAMHKVSRLDKIIGFAALAGVFITFILAAIFTDGFALGACICLIFCSVNALMPQIGWAFTRISLKFRFYIFLRIFSEETMLYFYNTQRKFSIYALFIMAVIFFIFSIGSVLS